MTPADGPSTEETGRTAVPFILGGLLCLAAALRIYGLDFQSLWIDELATWRRSGFGTVSAVLDRGVMTEIYPPAYHLLLHLVQKYAGSSESLLRLPSVIAGVLSVWLIFLTGRKLYGEREGLLAALFMAVMWCPIRYSQEARVYELLLLAGLASVYFAIDIVRDLRKGARPSMRTAAAYVLCALLGAYLHYFGLYFIALQAAAALLFFRKDRRSLSFCAAAYGLIAAAYLPWMPSMIRQIQTNTGRAISWIPAPKAGDFVGYLLFFFNNSPLVLLAAAALYGFLLIRSVRDSERSAGPGVWLALWLIVPFWGAFLASFLWIPILTFRNLIFALPAAYILLARCILRLPLKPPLRAGIGAAAGALLLFQLTVTMRYYTAPHKQQIREAVAHICAADRRAGGSGIVFGYPLKAMHFKYYCPRTSPPEYCSAKLSGPGSARRVRGPRQAKEAAERLGQAGLGRTWLLFAPGADDRALKTFTEEGWKQVSRADFFRVSAALLDKSEASGP